MPIHRSDGRIVSRTTPAVPSVASVTSPPQVIYRSVPVKGAKGDKGDPGVASEGLVCWAPSLDPTPDGAFVDFGDVVAALVAMTSPTTILQILADPGDTITLPGGTWQLNNTIIAGNTSDADSDSNYRGYQHLLEVTTEGDDENRCKILGCIGLKDMFFRPAESETTTELTADFSMPDVGNSVDIYVNNILGIEVGKLVFIDSAGFLRVSSIDAGGLFFTATNTGMAGNANFEDVISNQSVYPDNSVFYTNASGETEGTNFTLDNVDFRHAYGNYIFGSLHVDTDAGLFLHMKNGASTRWFGLRVDGYLAIQTDGTGCWVGSLAFFGDGYVDMFPMGGCQVRTWQSEIAEWTLHQPYTVYVPSNTSDWNGDPESIPEAIDRLAAAVKSLGGTI